jgi:hypothetical protein
MNFISHPLRKVLIVQAARSILFTVCSLHYFDQICVLDGYMHAVQGYDVFRFYYTVVVLVDFEEGFVN